MHVRVTPTAAAPLLAALAWLVVLSACGDGGGGRPGPTPVPAPAPVITAIVPAAGSTAGNTLVTITGANFTAGATVTIAGAVATDVTVQDATTLTARTAAHAAASGDVVVSVGGKSATLVAAFTYAIPGPSNNPAPVIVALEAQGSRRNEPERFADLGESIAIVAVVTDAETPSDGLAYEWKVESGTISGSGPSVAWKAPAQATTPASVPVTLTVIERFVTNDTPAPALRENRVDRSITIDLHDSAKEVGDMATRFLQTFSQSSIPPDDVMQDFLPGCYGEPEEREQVEDNRKRFTIIAWSVGPPSVSVDFGGTCAYRARSGDACSNSDVRWESIRLATGAKEGVIGVDQVAAVYKSGKWWLCDSQFDGRPLTTGRGLYESLTRSSNRGTRN